MLGFEKLALEVLVAVFVAAWVLGITYLTLRSFERYSGTLIVRRGARRFSAHRTSGRLPLPVRHRRAAHQDGRGTGVIANRAR
jgi:hypothetical protein